MASYATPGPVRTAAEIALEYTLLKWRYQSSAGKGTPVHDATGSTEPAGGSLKMIIYPMFSHYLKEPFHFNPYCSSTECPYENKQIRAFSLWTLLLLGVHRKSCNPLDEPVKKGHHFFARMQVRYSHRHYLQGKWPRYPVHPKPKPIPYVNLT